ncbi:MAG: GNAT family N-acetyltransferase [Ignavibacteriales bacterium]|nr:GNAT family N-acetyltransferase [Ignavibacteriales bacterium]
MIRKLKSDDRSQIENLLAHTNNFNKVECEIAMELIDIALLQPGQEDYNIFVYDEDGKVLGYHCTGKRALTDGVFDLYWIVVDPEKKNKGIGSQLLKHAEDLVANKGGRWLLAETSSKESYLATRDFYQRKKYSIVAQINDFYSLNDSLIIFGKYFK